MKNENLRKVKEEEGEDKKEKRFPHVPFYLQMNPIVDENFEIPNVQCLSCYEAFYLRHPTHNGLACCPFCGTGVTSQTIYFVASQFDSASINISLYFTQSLAKSAFITMLCNELSTDITPQQAEQYAEEGVYFSESGIYYWWGSQDVQQQVNPDILHLVYP